MNTTELEQEQNLELGRVITAHKERYIVRTHCGDVEAEISGSFRYRALQASEYPAVGDWVNLKCQHSFGIIQQVLPRQSILRRQAIGQQGSDQIIATNLDCALILMAADRDFNLNRLERFLALCHSSSIQPVVVLSKIDLAEPSEVDEIYERLTLRVPDQQVFAMSNIIEDSYKVLQRILEPGKTYCLLGSSGVGKSSLINNLLGQDWMQTKSISTSTQKGRHTTTHRQLFVLENGAMLIDNPGMREVGMVDAIHGLERTFTSISELAGQCKFRDCSHEHEKGCAVLLALEQGNLDTMAYSNYMKLKKESAHYEMSTVERRKREKVFCKMQKKFNTSASQFY